MSFEAVESLSGLAERYRLTRSVVATVLDGGSMVAVSQQYQIPAYRVKGMLLDCLRRIDESISLRRAELHERGQALNARIACTATMPGKQYDAPLLRIPMHYFLIPTGQVMHMRYAGIHTLGDFVARPRAEAVATRHLTARVYDGIVAVVAEVLRADVYSHRNLHQLSEATQDASLMAYWRDQVSF
jgi:hypothetical protein